MCWCAVPDAGSHAERLLLVTSLGDVYSFGDAAYFGPDAVVVRWSTQSLLRTATGSGCSTPTAWSTTSAIATNFGAPVGYVNGFNARHRHLPHRRRPGLLGGLGTRDVFTYGDFAVPGREAAAGLNGEIIAAFGF